jgi:hypothetical protein
MGGYRNASKSMDGPNHLFQSEIGCPDQESGIVTDYLTPLVHHQLFAESVRVILAAEILINDLLRRAKGMVVLEEAKHMHLFPRAYFYSADDGQPGILPGATGRLYVLSRVMVADSYQMKASLMGFTHHR